MNIRKSYFFLAILLITNFISCRRYWLQNWVIKVKQFVSGSLFFTSVSKQQYLMKFFLVFILLFNCNMIIAQTTVSLAFEDSLQYWMSVYKVPITSVGLIENNKVKLAKVYGADSNTLFNVASLTKPVTSIVTLKLINDNKWSMDEPLIRYWIDPDIKNDSFTKKITTRILLTHQSGFPNWRSDDSNHVLKFHFEPGTKYRYSGEGFEYLRRSLENGLHEDLQQIAFTNLFNQVGMNNTNYGWTENANTALYAVPNDTNGLPITSKPIKIINAADWLVTTIHDYTKFAAYVINGAGISKELFTMMTTPHVTMGKGVYTESMGLGWAVLTGLPDNEYLLMHTGHDDGVYSVVILLPKTERGIVIITNGENGIKVIFQLLKKILNIPGLVP